MYGRLHSHRGRVVESGLFHSASRSAYLSAFVAGRGTIAKSCGSHDGLRSQPQRVRMLLKNY
jgi:hypothetical protein